VPTDWRTDVNFSFADLQSQPEVRQRVTQEQDDEIEYMPPESTEPGNTQGSMRASTRNGADNVQGSI